ncbi:MAG: nucleoside recognition domain-containing protein [Dehalococcoidia bacterium]|nr:nucleoside recognition domain-containing protein [Dehalococcoidia bacterium]
MLETRAVPLKYDEALESALSRIESLLKGSYGVSRRAIGLLLLQGDRQVEKQVSEQDAPSFAGIQGIVAEARARYNQPLSYVIALRQQHEVKRILSATVTAKAKVGAGFAERLSRLMMSPITGVPILIIVLYLCLYQFVGVLGAQVAVKYIEDTIFGEWINPWVTELVTTYVPVTLVQDLFVGEFGIITLGVRYTFALILPIVTTFFIAFSIIEDSGYLPRLAMLIDRVFKFIGLTGRAVIPMVLGFGCDTMATIVTRTQESKREKVITTLLLALAIPCSAQLGVVFAILSGNVMALLIWVLAVFLIFLLVGYLAGKVIPGERSSFYMEVPPLRWPKLSNVMVKTLARLQWYFLEVFPVFIIASILLWAGKLTGAFDYISSGLEPLVRFIGLPPETSTIFLYGFFRRDFGAAGLYDLNEAGILVGVPLVVSAVTLTLFVPCIAQFSVMVKERGVKTAVAIALFIFPFAFLVGFVLNWALTSLGVSL